MDLGLQNSFSFRIKAIDSEGANVNRNSNEESQGNSDNGSDNVENSDNEMNTVQDENQNAESDGCLGAWYIGPAESYKKDLAERFVDKRPIIIFCHGSYGTRAESWRVSLYNVLAQQYHVIAFDYRGFGDSSAPPRSSASSRSSTSSSSSSTRVSEDSMVDDVISVFHHVVNHTKGAVMLWGHGLGSGVVCHATARLSGDRTLAFNSAAPPGRAKTGGRPSSSPTGVILSGTFFNFQDLIKKHRWFYWSGIPFYEQLFLDSVSKAGFECCNNEHLAQINSPVSILQSEDDQIVNFTSAFRLYKYGQNISRRSGHQRNFFGFLGKQGIGHSGLAQLPGLDIIMEELTKTNPNPNLNKNLHELQEKHDVMMMKSQSSHSGFGSQHRDLHCRIMMCDRDRDLK